MARTRDARAFERDGEDGGRFERARGVGEEFEGDKDGADVFEIVCAGRRI